MRIDDVVPRQATTQGEFNDPAMLAMPAMAMPAQLHKQKWPRKLKDTAPRLARADNLESRLLPVHTKT